MGAAAQARRYVDRGRACRRREGGDFALHVGLRRRCCSGDPDRHADGKRGDLAVGIRHRPGFPRPAGQRRAVEEIIVGYKRLLTGVVPHAL